MGIRISGTGCSLIDYIYLDVDLEASRVKRFLSKAPGDGGLSPGNLVFSEEFSAFAGVPVDTAIKEITGDTRSTVVNLGGPAIVALMNGAQLSDRGDMRFKFYGVLGNDRVGSRLFDLVSNTLVDTTKYQERPGSTPYTVVLSDPRMDSGHGERAFINNIGVAWEYSPTDLDPSFFDADITLFGGTALVPKLHEELGWLCRQAKEQQCLTIVNTVFDFRSEKRYPDGRWPVGESDATYTHIDLLVVDRTEALRMSGQAGVQEALDWFRGAGTRAAIITCGSDDLWFYSNGGPFLACEKKSFGVSHLARNRILTGEAKGGDTTGCGDNFVGGVLYSIAEQMGFFCPDTCSRIDLEEAITWGVASGAFACTHAGGTYLERWRGEKRERVKEYLLAYREQIGLDRRIQG